MGPSSPPLGAGRSDRPALWFGALLLFGAVLWAYLPALGNGFIWNDSDYVTRPELRSLAGLRRIWFEPGATEQYYPVLHSAFWLEHRLWGEAPLGYHLLNVLLHGTAVCGFALVLRRLAIPGGLLAALVFALHPVAAESVAWISEQKNTLSLVFYLAAALAYLRFVRERGAGRYLLALGFFLLALLSKSVTATLPAALLVVAWWRQGRLSWRQDVLPLAPWFGAGAVVGLFTAWIERTSIGAQGPDFALTWVQRCLVAGRALWFYLGKLAWPARLCFMYPRWTIDPHTPWLYLFPLAAVAVLVLLWRLRRRSRAPLAAALLFVGGLAPVLGFLNVYAFVFSFVADHFQYLACLPLIAAAAAAWDRFCRGRQAPAVVLVLRLATLGVLAALALLTWDQCENYRDEITLYRSILASNPDSWLAHYNLANILLGTGHRAEAILHYEEAVRIDPRLAGAEKNFGLALADSGEPAAAIPHYERALRLKPGDPAAEMNLGNAYWSLGRRPEAVLHYRNALLLRPDYAEAWFDLGQSLCALGDWREAVTALAQAVHFRPAFPEAVKSLAGARNDWGIELFTAGHWSEALAQFEQALQLDPTLTETERNLAVVLRRLGRAPEAQEHEAAAARLKPAPAKP